MDLFCYLCFVFVFAILSCVSCSLVVTCSERADHLALLCVGIFLCYCHLSSGFLCQVWYLIVSIPDLSLPPYFGS